MIRFRQKPHNLRFTMDSKPGTLKLIRTNYHFSRLDVEVQLTGIGYLLITDVPRLISASPLFKFFPSFFPSFPSIFSNLHHVHFVRIPFGPRNYHFGRRGVLCDFVIYS